MGKKDQGKAPLGKYQRSGRKEASTHVNFCRSYVNNSYKYRTKIGVHDHLPRHMDTKKKRHFGNFVGHDPSAVYVHLGHRKRNDGDHR